MEIGHAFGRRPEVVPSTCTLQCANAPVVNVCTVNAWGQARTAHHCRVDNPKRCADVLSCSPVQAEAPGDSERRIAGSSSRSSSSSMVEPMLRRSEGMRWNALRHEDRLNRNRRLTNADVSLLPLRSGGHNRQLTAALLAEANACQQDPERRARAERRARRMLGESEPETHRAAADATCTSPALSGNVEPSRSI